MDLNQVLYSIFRAEFESGSKIGPKPPQNPIFINFLKIAIFIEIRFLLIFIGAAASAGGPLNITLISNTVFHEKQAVIRRAGRRQGG